MFKKTKVSSFKTAADLFASFPSWYLKWALLLEVIRNSAGLRQNLWPYLGISSEKTTINDHALGCPNEVTASWKLMHVGFRKRQQISHTQPRWLSANYLRLRMTNGPKISRTIRNRKFCCVVEEVLIKKTQPCCFTQIVTLEWKRHGGLPWWANAHCSAILKKLQEVTSRCNI